MCVREREIATQKFCVHHEKSIDDELSVWNRFMHFEMLQHARPTHFDFRSIAIAVCMIRFTREYLSLEIMFELHLICLFFVCEQNRNRKSTVSSK